MRAVLYRLRAWARHGWKTAGALAVIVAIVGGASLTLAAGAVRTLTAPDRYSRSRGKVYDLQLQQPRGLPRLAEFRSLPAIRRIDAATFVFGAVTRRGSDQAIANALVFAGSVGPLGARLVAGREPDPTHPEEFVASTTFRSVTKASLGDRFELATLAQDQADRAGFDSPDPGGPRLSARLVGLIDGPSELQDGYIVTLFPASLLGVGDIGTSATVASVGLRKGATASDLRRQLDSLPGGTAITIDKATWVPREVRAAVNGTAEGLLVVALIVALASIAVLGQLLTRQFRPPDEERTVLRSLGCTRAQVIGDPIGRAAVPVVVGLAAGLVLAYAVSDVFPRGFVRKVEPRPGRRVEPLIHGLGPVVFGGAVLVWMVVSLAVLARERPRLERPGLVDKAAHAMPTAAAATAVRFAFAHTGRRSRSSRIPLVGLAAVFCVLFGAVTFGASLGSFTDKPSAYGLNFDGGLGSGGTELAPQVRQQLEASNDVTALTFFATSTATAKGRSVPVVGFAPVRGDIAPVTLSGRLPRSEDELALGKTMARGLHVGVGRKLTLKSDAGEKVFRVTGLVVVPPVEGVDQVGQGAVVTPSGLGRIDPAATFTDAGIDVPAQDKAGAFRRVSELTGMGVGRFDSPSAIVNLRRVRGIPFVVACAVGLLGLLSVGHLMIVAVQRGRHDIAVLRALGADRRWAARLVHWQATITATVVLVLAVPVGIAAGSILYRRFLDRLGSRIEVLVPGALVAAAAVAVVALVNAAAWIPARRARRLPPARILAAD